MKIQTVQCLTERLKVGSCLIKKNETKDGLFCTCCGLDFQLFTVQTGTVHIKARQSLENARNLDVIFLVLS